MNLFGVPKQTVDQALEATAESLRLYGASHPHWCVAWSGGKDSTATLTAVLYLIDSGAVPRPERMTVLYADTRMELVPLWAVRELLAQCATDDERAGILAGSFVLAEDEA